MPARRHDHQTQRGDRFLVVKLDGLGGALTITPALRALRDTFPDARIEALVTPAGAATLAGTGLVDEAIPIVDHPFQTGTPWSPGRFISAWRIGRQLGSRSYDRAFLFHHLLGKGEAAGFAALLSAAGGRRVGLDNGRGWFLHDRATDFGFGARHEVEYWLDVAASIGAVASEVRLAIGRSVEADDRAEALLAGLTRPRLAIHAGSGAVSTARRWPMAHFAAVASRVHDVLGAEIVLIGGPDETGLNADLARRIDRPVRDLAGRTDVPALAAVLARCDVLVANDGGVAQAGAAVGIPTVAVFGPSNHEAWRPWTGEGETDAAQTVSGLALALPAVTVVRSDIVCSPCFYVAKGLGTPQGCATRACLTRDLAPGQVGQAISRYLGARKRALGAAGR